MTGFLAWLYGAPVWQMGLVVTTTMVGGTLLALFVVDRFWSKELRSRHNDIVGFLIAVVGIVYAIMVSSLAIPAMTRQDHASAIVLREADTVADLAREETALPPAVRKEFHAHLIAYVDAVVGKEWPQMREAVRPTEAEGAADQLWQDVSGVPISNLMDSVVVTDLRHHVDELEEARLERSILATSGVDRYVWGVVLLGSASTILFAVLFGVPHFAAHVVMTALFAFTLALAIVMIIAVDWPFFGDDAIGPDSLVALRSSLSSPARSSVISPTPPHGDDKG